MMQPSMKQTIVQATVPIGIARGDSHVLPTRSALMLSRAATYQDTTAGFLELLEFEVKHCVDGKIQAGLSEVR